MKAGNGEREERKNTPFIPQMKKREMLKKTRRDIITSSALVTKRKQTARKIDSNRGCFRPSKRESIYRMARFQKFLQGQ